MASGVSDPLRVFLTADPELPVPPRHYGGIERIIALLADGLTRRGHEVTLFAHPESQPACRLVPYRGRRSASGPDSMANAWQIGRAVWRERPDVVQSFGRLAYLMPVMASTSLKVMSYQRAVTPRSVRLGNWLGRDRIAWTGCSASLIEPVRQNGRWFVIHNAVDVTAYTGADTVPADAPLAFLGRIESIKGTHLAIEVAQRSGRRLVIAGNVPDEPEHREYYRTQVAPRVDGSRVVYLGPVDDRAKNELLSSSAALLMPIQWDEPFGIVMAEALACGAPVIGLRRGSVPEVIEDGVTGFVCDTLDEMVSAVARLGSLDRSACRRVAVERFSGHALVNAYESLYRELLRPGHRPADAPAIAGPHA
ncbi:MAG: glycosyltransferase family 4 protein [Vicinamibacterales bacterium]